MVLLNVSAWSITFTLLNCLGLFPGELTMATGIYLSAETRLIRFLFKDYETQSRPVLNSLDTVQIALTFFIQSLDEVNTKLQYISVHGWLKVTWSEERLTWNESQYEGLKQITVSPTKVWLPDFTLSNSARGFFSEHECKFCLVKVHNDGMVLWEPGGEFTSHCDLDITYFPFDLQVCSFKFITWTYTEEQTNLTFKEQGGIPIRQHNGEWNVLASRTYRYNDVLTFSYYNNQTSYPIVKYQLLLQRRPAFYITNIICPTLMLAFLALLMFFLPLESGERVSMGVTLLLAFSVFFLIISENTPNTSPNVPLIQIYLLMFMGLTCCATAVTILVLYCHHHSPDIPPPSWMCTDHRRNLEIFTGDSCSEDTVRKINKDEKRYSFGKAVGICERQNEIAELWKGIAKRVDKVCFWIFMPLFVLSAVITIGVIPMTRNKDFEGYEI